MSKISVSFIFDNLKVIYALLKAYVMSHSSASITGILLSGTSPCSNEVSGFRVKFFGLDFSTWPFYDNLEYSFALLENLPLHFHIAKKGKQLRAMVP